VSKQPSISGSVKLNDYQKSILDVICKKSGQTCKSDTYYLNRLNDIYEGNKVFSFNWAAALFGPLWFIYRKMYLCVLALLCLSGFSIPLLSIPSILDYKLLEALGKRYIALQLFAFLASCIVYGYAGNICYYSFIGKKSKQNMHNNYSATHSPLFMGLLCTASVLLASGVYYFVIR
jgi:hypothetical protein